MDRTAHTETTNGIYVESFLDEQEWLALLDATWPRIKNADDYRDALLQTPYARVSGKK